MVRAAIWVAVTAAAGYLGAVIYSGWADVAAGVSQIGAGGLAVALLLSLANYGARYLRWQIVLANIGHRIPHRENMAIYLSGFALTATPGKAGELIRSTLLSKHGVPYPHSFAAFVGERLADLLGVLVIAAIGLSGFEQLRGWIIGGFAVVAVAIAGAWLAGRTTKNTGRLASFLEAVRSSVSRRTLAPILILSVIGWAAEAYAFALIANWLGCGISELQALFIFSFSMMAGAASFLPGGLGGTEAAMLSLLALAGSDPARAVAATVVIRLTTLWFAVAIGLAVMASSKPASLLSSCEGFKK